MASLASSGHLDHQETPVLIESCRLLGEKVKSALGCESVWTPLGRGWCDGFLQLISPDQRAEQLRTSAPEYDYIDTALVLENGQSVLAIDINRLGTSAINAANFIAGKV